MACTACICEDEEIEEKALWFSFARSLSFSFYPSIIIRMGMTVDIGRHNVYTETEFGRAKRKENTF